MHEVSPNHEPRQRVRMRPASPVTMIRKELSQDSIGQAIPPLVGRGGDSPKTREVEVPPAGPGVESEGVIAANRPRRFLRAALDEPGTDGSVPTEGVGLPNLGRSDRPAVPTRDRSFASHPANWLAPLFVLPLGLVGLEAWAGDLTYGSIFSAFALAGGAAVASQACTRTGMFAPALSGISAKAPKSGPEPLTGHGPGSTEFDRALDTYRDGLGRAPEQNTFTILPPPVPPYIGGMGSSRGWPRKG